MTLEYIECPGAEALSRWQDLRDQFQSTGKYPFLVGDEKDLGRLLDAAEYDSRESARIIEQSLEINAQSWLDEREAEMSEYDSLDKREITGEWPDQYPKQEAIATHRDISTGKVKPIIFIGLAKVEQPWMLPATVQYGGWNSCPDATIQCAMMRHWADKYGAEIVAMSGDVIECRVENPPTTREAAIALAWEQYLYCNDIVDQGTETISNLAASLINAEYWFFWWD